MSLLSWKRDASGNKRRCKTKLFINLPTLCVVVVVGAFATEQG